MVTEWLPRRVGRYSAEGLSRMQGGTYVTEYLDRFSFVAICWLTRGLIIVDVGVVIGDMYEVMTHPDILPSFLPILRRELPRPRVLHALLRFAHFEEKDNPRLKQFPGVVARHVTMGQCAWRMWYALERASFVHRRCMRRGCTRTSRFRCKACRSTMYCGFDCQTMYVHILCSPGMTFSGHGCLHSYWRIGTGQSID